jgi:putative redox protein
MSTLQATIEQTGPTVANALVRSHTVTIDRPIARGGTDQGPLGGEYLLVALGGCFMSNLLAAARAREAAISHVRIEVSGTMVGTPDRFVDFLLNISAEHRDSAMMRKLIGIAARACAVTNTLRQSAAVALMFEGATVELSEEAGVER